MASTDFQNREARLRFPNSHTARIFSRRSTAEISKFSPSTDFHSLFLFPTGVKRSTRPEIPFLVTAVSLGASEYLVENTFHDLLFVFRSEFGGDTFFLKKTCQSYPFTSENVTYFAIFRWGFANRPSRMLLPRRQLCGEKALVIMSYHWSISKHKNDF